MLIHGPWIVYCGLIFWLSHQPSLPGTPGGDKIAHFIAYFIMGGLFLRALALSFRWKRRALVLMAAVIGSLYGVSDEFHQSFIPGRFAALDDVVADMMGSIFGAVCTSWFYVLDQGGRWSFRFMR
ncbi:MAG: VanZ family protein [Myxococcota bacterium]|nr:VanZ family protein [Myxococcota bacterium]